MGPKELGGGKGRGGKEGYGVPPPSPRLAGREQHHTGPSKWAGEWLHREGGGIR